MNYLKINSFHHLLHPLYNQLGHPLLLLLFLFHRQPIQLYHMLIFSAKDLLKQSNLLKLSENGNVADLTEEGYNASKYNSVQDYQRYVNKKVQTKLLIDKISKIAPIISTLVALVTAVAGFVTGHISIGVIVTILLIGIAIGFFINESIHKIYGKA